MPRTAQQTFDAAASLSHQWPLASEVLSSGSQQTKCQLMSYLTELSRLYFEMGVVSAIPNATDDDVRDCWLRATLEPKVFEGYREHVRRQREKKASKQRADADSGEAS